MKRKLDIERVLTALRKVPAKHLRIIDLTNQMATPTGDLDTDQIKSREPEINLAVAEAKSYANATSKAIEALKKLKPRSEEV